MTPRRPAPHDVMPSDLGGAPTVVVAPVIPDAAPGEVREGLARRRIVMTGGTCPCGARLRLPNRAARRRAIRAGEALSVRVEHEDGCPAITANLDAAANGQRR